MVKIIDGWIEGFLRVDGHPLKVYTQSNTGDNGLACHSVVGEEADELDGIPNRFLSDERNADGSFTDAAAASVMFVLRKRRPSVQMYPITASTWTSGGREANTTMWAMEAEGGGYVKNASGILVPNFSEPLTKKQEDEFLLIATAWEQVKKRKLVVGQTVLAHWQIAKKYNYAATACESGRYANAWARLAAGERAEQVTDGMMTQAQFNAMFEQAMGLYFPAYLEAYYRGGFTARNGRLDPGEASDPGPLTHEPDLMGALLAMREALNVYLAGAK